MKNKKILWILPIMFLLLLSFASAVIDWDTDVDAYIPLWNYTAGATGLEDISGQGSTCTANGGAVYNTSKDSFVAGTGDYINCGDDFDFGTSYSLSLWLKTSDTSGRFLFKNSGSPNRNYFFDLDSGIPNALLSDNGIDNTLDKAFSAGSISDDVFNHIVFVYSGSSQTLKFYKNGVLIDTLSSSDGVPSSINNNAENFNIMSQAGTSELLGYYSDFIAFNKSLSDSEVTSIYNEGRNYNPYASSISSNFSVSVVDFWDDSSVNNITVKVDGETYQNITGNTVTTHLLQNDSSTYLVEVYANNYFGRNYTSQSVSSNLEAVLHQSEISFASYEYISNNSISSCNYTISGQQNTTFYLNDGEHTVLVECPSYYAVNHTFNVTALDIRTENVTGLYNSVMNINLTDVITTDLIESNSYVTVNNNDGFEQTFSNSNGSISVNLVQDNYSLTLWADNYAFRSENVTLDGAVENFAYSLYANNSLWVTALDQNTGASLNNFSVEVFDTNTSYYSTDNNTGTIRLNNITSGVYTVRVDKEGYAVAEYALTMTGGSHQSLIAYLVASGSTTIFTVVDSISGGIIEGAQASMYKTINSTWTLVSAQETDITGRVQYTYIPNIQYKFVIDATGYEQREFFLKPLFSTYTIRLTPDVTSVPDENTGSYVYAINNSGLFYDDQNNSVEISIYSGTGTIEYYYLNVTNYDDSVSSFTCLTAQGCADSMTLEITNALFNDSVVVEYWIKESGRSEKYFRKVYYVQDVYDPSTLEGWKDVDDDQVDDLSKAFIATLIMIIVVGLVSLGSIAVGAPPITISGIVLGVLVEVFAYVNFIPNLAGHLVALGCLLIVLFGRGEI